MREKAKAKSAKSADTKVRRKTTARPTLWVAETPKAILAAPKVGRKAKGEPEVRMGANGTMAPLTNSDSAQAESAVQTNTAGQRPGGRARISAPKSGGGAQTPREGHSLIGSPDNSPQGAGGATHMQVESHLSHGRAVTSSICQQLQELQSTRRFYIKLTVKMTNSCRGLVMGALGYNPAMTGKAEESIKSRAATIVKLAFAGKEQEGEDGETVKLVAAELAVVGLALKSIKARHDEIQKTMIKLARTLPAYPFAKGVAGFGDKALAIMIGETGDLWNYDGPRKVWKRCGLAPYEGKAMSTWRSPARRAAPELSKDEWKAAGYKPQRRAEIHACIAEPMEKHQIQSREKSGTEFGRPKGRYGEIYVQRREHTKVTHPDWTKGHSRDDALRIMTKSVIADLWSAWRGSSQTVAELPGVILAPAPILQAAE